MNLGIDYLKARGIHEATILEQAIEITPPDPALILSRLNEDIGGLSRLSEEIIWFPTDSTFIARPLPALSPTIKFLTAKNGSSPLYIPRTLVGLERGQALIITEGPVKTLACIQGGFAAVGLNGVWGAAKKEPDGKLILRPELTDLDLRGRKVYVAFDADSAINPDVHHAFIRLCFLLSAAGAQVFQLTSWPLEEGKGIDDFLVNQLAKDSLIAADILAMLVSDAVPWLNTITKAKTDLDAVCSELVKTRLSKTYRAQLCRELAGLLGVPTDVLRSVNEEDKPEDEAETRFRFQTELEPWSEVVRGEELLKAIIDTLKRFVIVGPDDRLLIALWTLLTYLIDCFSKLPVLRAISPMKRCGKSTLIDVLEQLVDKALVTATISPPSLFRLIEKYHPTVLMDEADVFAKDNEDLRGIINGGFERGRPAIRVNKETMEPEFFDTFGCKLLASIKSLHETIEDRSLFIEMQRKGRGEKIEELCDCPLASFLELRRKFKRWASDNADRIRDTRLIRPEALDSRSWNKWRPLLVIAKTIGGAWYKDACTAAISGALEGETEDQQSELVEILLRMRELFEEGEREGVFKARGAKFLSTIEILDGLNADEEASWADRKTGSKEGLTAEVLAKHLRSLKIKSDRVTLAPKKKVKGYYLDESLGKVFERYLGSNPPSPPPPPPSSSSSSSEDDFEGGSPSGGAPKDPSQGPTDNVAPSSGESASEDTPPPVSPEKPCPPCPEDVTPSDSTISRGRVDENNSVRDRVSNPNTASLSTSFSSTCVDGTGLAGFSGGTVREGDMGIIIGLDLETYGPGKFSKKGKFLRDPDALSPWRGQIRLVTYVDSGGKIRQHDLQAGPLPAEAIEQLANSGWVTHNAKFEMMFLARTFGVMPRGVFCTMTASRLLTNGSGTEEEEHSLLEEPPPKCKRAGVNSLKNVLARHLEVHLPKEQGSSYWGAEELTSEQIAYSLDDVRYLLPLAEKLDAAVRDQGLEEVFTLESRLLPVVVKMELHGFALDREKLGARLEPMAERAAFYEALAKETCGPGAPKWGDAKGLKKWLRALGADLDDVQEESLLRSGHPAALAVVGYRHVKKKLDVAEALLKASESDGRVHASFNPLGPHTGRFSCSDFNIQNISRDEGLYRDCFIASASNRILVVADYSNIELRVAAIVAKDAAMLDAFREGRDIHRATAAAVLGRVEEEITSGNRQLAKAVNFGFLYGQRPQGFLAYARANYGIELTLEEATAFRQVFFAQYPGLKKWHQRAWHQAELIDEVRTIIGRRQLLGRKDSKWARFQALTNTVVSGSAADLIKTAMVLLDEALPPDAHLVMTCHDELIVDAPQGRAEETKVIMQQAMEEAFTQLFGDTIPVTVAPKAVQNWQEKK